ncbi:MAG: hypothetical protein WCF40_15145 [Desulfobacterales bacterium]
MVGGGRITVIAGPCAIESRDQALTNAHLVKKAGADGLMIEVHHEPDKALSDGPLSALS